MEKKLTSNRSSISKDSSSLNEIISSSWSNESNNICDHNWSIFRFEYPVTFGKEDRSLLLMNSTFDHQTTPVHDLFAIVALLIYDLLELRRPSDTTLANPTVVAFFVGNLFSFFSLFSLFLMLPPDRRILLDNFFLCQYAKIPSMRLYLSVEFIHCDILPEWSFKRDCNTFYVTPWSFLVCYLDFHVV